MAQIDKERDEKLATLIRVERAVKDISIGALYKRLKVPMCNETLRLKLKTPTAMKVCELRDVCDALGIPEESWKAII